MSAEFTFVAIRHRAIQGALFGRTIEKFEENNLRIIGMKLLLERTGYLGICEEDGMIKSEITERHAPGPVIVVLVRGESAIQRVRELLEEIENANENLSKLMARDEGGFPRTDMFHASDCVVSAKQEVTHWFSSEELDELAPTIGGWLNSTESTKWTRRCEGGVFTDDEEENEEEESF